MRTKKDGEVEGYVAGSSYTIYSCETCATKWCFPHVAGKEVYDLIYSHRDGAPGYARYAQYARDVLKTRNPLRFISSQEEMYYAVVKEIKQNLETKGTILDVGCGLGYLTYALHQSGYEATGIDISLEAIQQARKIYGNYFVCDDFFLFKGSEGGYDVICMLELIEHVDNPKAYISKALMLLKPGGLLIVTTPNRSFFTKEALWNTELPPVHLNWFSEDGIRSLAENLSLSVNFFDFTSYNILHGDLNTSTNGESSQRTSIFSEEGKPLYEPYVKSRLRIVTEKLHIYPPLKTIRHVKRKTFEFSKILLSSKTLYQKRSNILCVTMRRREKNVVV
jgi:SAM-dependent methyltransferase